ncbi:MAG: elongation factor EF-2 [Candidatus Micrarchaeota archaeon]|nr:elongation factor EF-2 [Candidatus Micrarchaeota archaeon]MCX8154575.1 elongation factor EF-2 [Candidatus Micrarchaeota archaeon]
MARKEYVVEEVIKIMNNIDNVRNIAIIAHVDHGKSTLTDSLVARAGLISKELAGEQRILDFEELEQKRGITIKAANISLGFNYKGKDYVINLIDTPGHVDFGGHVTRALRAVDGVILVVDSVEGVMPQTETVLRQALKERARPVVFINKVDRLINELKLDSKQMMERIGKIINNINKIIESAAPPEFKSSWKVSVEAGTVAIGSAFNKWALSLPYLKERGISFQKLYELVQQEKKKEAIELAPLDEVILGMVIQHLPNPKRAQEYRIKHLWHGDYESEVGKSMLSCNQNGPLVGVVIGVVHDKNAGEISVLRLFSGKVNKGQDVYIISRNELTKIQQVAIYMGPDRVNVDSVIAGNIAAVIGLKDVFIGETVSSQVIEPFEQIKHYSEPVVTKSIEPKNSKDLAKLIEVLKQLSREDPTLKVEINHETGEYLISGMGELHLEIVEHKIKNEHGVEIVVSPPIVVYRETIRNDLKEPIESKSPNKHNRFYIVVERLPEEVKKWIIEQGFMGGKIKNPDYVVKKLVELGMDRDEAKNFWSIYDGNIFINATKGIQYLNEAQELIIQGFIEAMQKGPLAQEKVVGVKVKLVDALLHEDHVHRGPAQIIPAVKRGIYAAMIKAGTNLLEPKQKVLFQVPHEYSGAILNIVNGKRGQLLDMQQDEETTSITSIFPVSEMFGFSNEVRGASQGRALWYPEYWGFEEIPRELLDRTVRSIRERKGLPPEPPTVDVFLE